MTRISINAPATSLAVTTTTANVALPSSSAKDLAIFNDGAVTVYLKSGSSSVTASVTDGFIPPAAYVTFEIDPSHTHIAAITASGSATLRIQRGNED